MSARSITIATTGQKTHACSCGCTPHDKICCQLDCLERPRFFCGQLLTDQDLTALVNWTQEKLRLPRFKHGWGVVCGLEVRHHPDNASRIIVSTGYAVNCCGDDIVVCTEAEHDLSNACPARTEACAELKNSGDDGDGEQVYFGSQSFAKADLCPVDLTLRYVEAEAIPQTALGRSACREVAQCEYSRTRESYTLTAQAGNGSNPPQEVADRWRKAYQEWVTAQIGAPQVADALFRIMQRFHAAPLPGDCSSCLEDAGVPLARIWLLRPTNRREPASVLAIDAYPPYRRPFMIEPWPAPPAQTNLARFLWQRYSNHINEVDAALAEWGLQVQEKQWLSAENALEVMRSANVFWGYTTPLYVYTTDMGALGERIVGFGDKPIADEGGKGVALHQSATLRQAESAPPPPARDDLTRISGIGRRSSEELYAKGYTRYTDIAAMTTTDLRAILTRPISDEVLAAIIARARELAG